MARSPDVYRQWVQQSARLAGLTGVVRSMIELQHCGTLDLVLRAIEDEHPASAEAETDPEFLTPTWQVMLSGLWVGKAYQITWLLSKRRFKGKWPELSALLHDLELLRVPLEKHEIAKDSDLKGASLQFVRSPPNGDQSDFVEYRGGDPSRAHIMPMGMSARGSIVWQAVDIRGRDAKWLERRDLADRLLALTPPATEP